MKDFCIIVKNSIVPFGKYDAMAVFPFVFIKGNVSDKVIRHEKIHCQQQREMGTIGVILAAILFLAGCGWWSLLSLPLFYWWYGIEYVVRLILNGDKYFDISFEKEAYINDDSTDYIDSRQPFAWVEYL